MLDKQDVGNECSKQGKSSTQNKKNITISQMDVFSNILGGTKIQQVSKTVIYMKENIPLKCLNNK